MTVQRAALELRAGEIPADLWDRVADLLALADRQLADGALDEAGTRLQEAFNLAFHRTLHFEDVPSVLAADVERFLAPFRASKTFELATARSGGARPAPAHSPPPTRPRRLLFTTFMNWNFVGDIVEDYRVSPGVEVRTLDLQQLPPGPWVSQPVDIVKRRLHQMVGTDDRQPPADVREAFYWADVIFVEWGHRALPWVSLLPDLSARVVARIHSYEAFTPMPMHTDWSGIDDLVFVSPHIRALVEASVPGLAAPGGVGGPRLHTIPNRNLLDTFVRPKTQGAARTMGLVGWNNVTKDPMWALEVFEAVRAQDPAWRLRLLGHNFPRSGLTGPATDYRDRLEKRLDALGDAVERPGYTTDVPEALREIGVILSSSRREGTHEGLLQAVASGCYPVVRNWPYVARFGGAATMVPESWVVESPAAGAQALLEAAADADVFARECAARASWVRERYDWSVVKPQLDALLLTDVKGATG